MFLLFHLLIDHLIIMVTVLFKVLISMSFQDGFDLCNSYHRSYPRKDQVQSEKYTQGSYKNTDLNPGRRIITPTGRQIITRQTGRNNHKPLKPHSDIDK